MVCPIGSGRMAVMARLLEAESFSHTIAEEVSHQKLAAQYFYRELREADEANLLDEEDMHVFGLEPMADPLQLVCCKACKKPIKASQYVAHAELCRSLHSMGDTILEVESEQTTPVEHERHELVNASDTAVLESRLEAQIGMKSLSAVEAKETPVSANVAHVADGFGMSPGNTDYSDSMMPPAKRLKLISDVPAPLATKTYYSQRSNRLRSTLTNLYCKASAKELYTDTMSPKISQERKMLIQTSSRKDSSLEGMDDQHKSDKYSMAPFQEPYFVAQQSEVCLGKLGRSPAGVNFSDQVPADAVSRPEIAHVGFIGSKYLLKPFSVSSGKTLGGIQQHPNGGVPVT